jgi:hypothetical protein
MKCANCKGCGAVHAAEPFSGSRPAYDDPTVDCPNCGGCGQVPGVELSVLGSLVELARARFGDKVMVHWDDAMALAQDAYEMGRAAGKNDLTEGVVDLAAKAVIPDLGQA